MSDLFSGICVGGPYDGKRYSHYRDVLYVLEMDEIPIDPTRAVEAVMPAPRRHVYNMEYLQFGSYGDIPFWVCGMSPKEAVEQVFAAYRGKDGQETKVR